MISDYQTRLGRLGIQFPFMVGPMVGLSHVVFRELIRQYTPEGLEVLRFTEMLSTRRIPSQHLDSCDSLRHAPGEYFFIPQLLGNEEQFISTSIRKLLPAHPWGFDINMGCPVTHSLRHNWGVLLMGDLHYAAEVVRITKRHSPLPVSVKLRAGNADKIDMAYLLDFTKALEDAGADWITIHARPRDRKHHGYADWDAVAAVAAQRSIPVVANGDIQTAEDAVSLIRDYHVDGAMLARAAAARPWLIWQIAQKLGLETTPPGREGETPPDSPEAEGREYFRACHGFINLLETYYGDTPLGLKKLVFFLGIGSKWYLFGHDFLRNARRAKNLVEARRIIGDYQAKYVFPSRQRIHCFD
jgi:tRNA-dihydrouridine synthase B